MRQKQDCRAEFPVPDRLAIEAFVRAATLGDDEDVAAFLARYGSAPIDAINLNGHTVLGIATCNNQQGVIRLLLEGGADVNKKDRHGHTPLMWAVKKVPSDKSLLWVISQLLGRGASVDECYGDGTALMASVRKLWWNRELAGLFEKTIKTRTRKIEAKKQRELKKQQAVEEDIAAVYTGIREGICVEPIRFLKKSGPQKP